MPDPGKRHLVRAIGRWSLAALMVNLIVGSGIYGLPAIVTRLVGAASLWAYGFAALATAIIMACFAEVASRFTASGGIYLYTRTAFGPITGVVMAWFGCLVRLTAAASNANLFVIYLAEFWPGARAALPRFLILTVLIGVLALVNYIGVQSGLRVSNFFTVAKLAPLVVFVTAGIFFIASRHLPVVTGMPARPVGPWLQSTLLLMFAFGGFEAGLMPAGESKDPRRDSAFALFTALAVCSVLYLLIQLVVMAVLAGSPPSDRPLSAAAHFFLGPGGTVLMTLSILLSMYGVLSANILAVPRLMFAMAERGDLPSLLGRVHERFRTPHVAICLFALLLWIFALRASFEWNLTLSAVARLVYYGSVCVALPVLRKTGPPAAFQVPLGNGFAALGVALSLVLLTRVDRSGVLVLLLVTGLALVNGFWARQRTAKQNVVGSARERQDYTCLAYIEGARLNPAMMRRIMRRLRTLIKQVEKLLLMPAYFRALAKEWLNILFGETLLGIGFLIWWALGAPTNHALEVVFVIAMLVAGYYAWRADHVRLIPRLKIIGFRFQGTPVTRQIFGMNGMPLQEEILDHRTFVQLLPKCLTDSPVYECLAHLQKVQKFVNDHWEETDLDINLLLTAEKEHYPGSEHPINVFFVQHKNQQIIPNLWQADIPLAKFASIFKLNTQGITVFRFYVQITYSDRISGNFVSVDKPVRVYLDATFGNDPLSPGIEVKELDF